MSNYKKMMGYGDKKKVTKKQTKPKKNQILEGIKTELKEWDSIKSSPKRWSKTFDGNTGLTEYEQGKVYTDKDRPPFKTEAQIQEGPSYEYAKHIKKIEIPVMGGPNVAITGKLVMMASGPKDSFEHYKIIFEKIANKIFFLGEQGIANSIKLAMNLQITMLALSLSEGITLLKKSNVDPKIFLEVLNSTYFKTGMSENKAFKMIEGNYDATFTLSNLKKDITTMTSTAKSLGIDLPMIRKAEEIYENAINEGLGDYDYTGIIEYIKKINNF